MNNTDQQIKQALSRFREKFVVTQEVQGEDISWIKSVVAEKIEQFLESELSQIAKESEREAWKKFIVVLQDVVIDEKEKIKLKNRYGIDLKMEKVYAELEEARKMVEEYLKQSKERKNDE